MAGNAASCGCTRVCSGGSVPSVPTVPNCGVMAACSAGMAGNAASCGCTRVCSGGSVPSVPSVPNCGVMAACCTGMAGNAASCGCTRRAWATTGGNAGTGCMGGTVGAASAIPAAPKVMPAAVVRRPVPMRPSAFCAPASPPSRPWVKPAMVKPPSVANTRLGDLMPSRFLMRVIALLATPPSASLAAPAMPMMPLINPLTIFLPISIICGARVPRNCTVLFHMAINPSFTRWPLPVNKPAMISHMAAKFVTMAAATVPSI